MNCHPLSLVAALFAALCPINVMAADEASVPAKVTAPITAKPIPALSFFLVNDNRLTYAYDFAYRSPGTIGPGTKHVLAFTHFDTWAYGSNSVNFYVGKNSHAEPAAGCSLPDRGCTGVTEYGYQFKSTFGFNEIFETKAFSIGPLRNVELAVGGYDALKNSSGGIDRTAVQVGLQFSFQLPYKGYFTIAPQYYKAWQYLSAYTAAANQPAYPGVPNGWLDYKGTWWIDIGYYMDLGFLPDYLPLSISGRYFIFGPMGTGAKPGSLPAVFMPETKMEFNGEPIRLTLDFSKLVWGPQYSHFTDVWIAYKYRYNTYGFDNKTSPLCARNACEISEAYAGVTVKF
ncbi:hypothetical protein I6F35_28280 [Bradyrhizobium sp. BRP22]|uniref:hypothetical protein n=1 Tax=Bradyrhizobium sp. BRP22 TaxID=2793821 RepID=UPI001CD4230A|nr:hypothetical protein [Bradyrhizobium sp. BRP22]MCA1457069.1 hypothetical protein [Bradyrhizobium sp. BRP22]